MTRPIRVATQTWDLIDAIQARDPQSTVARVRRLTTLMLDGIRHAAT